MLTNLIYKLSSIFEMALIYTAGTLLTDWRGYLKKNVKNHEFIDFDHVNQQSIATFTYEDFKNIDRSDIVLAYTMKGEMPHPGTSSEIGYGYAKKKLVLYIEENPVPYPILVGLSKRFFSNLETVVYYLNHLKSVKNEDEFNAIYKTLKEFNKK